MVNYDEYKTTETKCSYEVQHIHNSTKLQMCKLREAFTDKILYENFAVKFYVRVIHYLMWGKAP